jgi:hypothetical protein
MDISSLKPMEKGAQLHIVHPVTNEDTGIVITLLGTDSAEWKQCAREIKNRALRNGKRKLSDDEMETLPYEMLSSITIGWEGMEEGGNPVKFSKEEAMRIYRDVPVIGEQVDKFVGERANFLPNA